MNIEKYKNLEKILKKYPDILTEMDIVKIDKQILEAYTYDKPLTCIEVENGEYERVLQLIAKLKDYFYVIHASYELEPEIRGFEGEIFITRFKNVYDVVKLLVEKDLKDNNGMLSKGFIDKYADLFGVLFGYPPKDVARHCIEKAPKIYHLIK